MRTSFVSKGVAVIAVVALLSFFETGRQLPVDFESSKSFLFAITGWLAVCFLYLGLRGFYLDSQTAAQTDQRPKLAKLFVLIMILNNLAFFAWGFSDPLSFVGFKKWIYPPMANALLLVIAYQHLIKPRLGVSTVFGVFALNLVLTAGIGLVALSTEKVGLAVEQASEWSFAVLLVVGRLLQIAANYLRPPKPATLPYWWSQVCGRSLWLVFHLGYFEWGGVIGQGAAVLLSAIVVAQEHGFLWAGSGVRHLNGPAGRFLRFWLT